MEAWCVGPDTYRQVYVSNRVEERFTSVPRIGVGRGPCKMRRYTRSPLPPFQYDHDQVAGYLVGLVENYNTLWRALCGKGQKGIDLGLVLDHLSWNAMYNGEYSNGDADVKGGAYAFLRNCKTVGRAAEGGKGKQAQLTRSSRMQTSPPK